MVGQLLRIIAQAGETERLLTLHDATVAGVLLVGIIFVTLAFIRGWVVTGAQYRKVWRTPGIRLGWGMPSSAATST